MGTGESLRAMISRPAMITEARSAATTALCQIGPWRLVCCHGIATQRNDEVPEARSAQSDCSGGSW